MYNPTPDSLNVRWEPASGQVQQYRVAYSALRGAARPGSVSGVQLVKTEELARGLEERGDLQRQKRWNVIKAVMVFKIRDRPTDR